MTDSSAANRAEPGSADPDAVRADIERTRADLADTVDQLSDKLNVKAQASDRVSAAKDKVTETAARAKAAAPSQVQQAIDRAGEKVGPIAHQTSEKAAPHRGKIIAGALAALLVLAVVRRRGGRTES